jgi:Cytochrome c oxidase subunit IV
MNVGLRLLISSAAFGVCIALVYWFSSFDSTGTTMLGMMAAALVFAAGYIRFAEREARLVGDRTSADNRDAQGEIVGSFTLASPWPIVCAAGLFMLLLGLIGWATLAYAGGGLVLYSLHRMTREVR